MLPAAFFSPLLAQAAATADKIDASNPTVFMGLLIGAIVTLVTVSDRVDNIIQRRKRQPTLDAQLAQITSALVTLTSGVGELKISHDKHSGHALEIGLLKARCEALQTKAEKLEEAAKADAAANRKYTMETTREIFELMRSQARENHAELKAVASTMNTMFNDFSRQIGGLTEAVKNAQE